MLLQVIFVEFAVCFFLVTGAQGPQLLSELLARQGCSNCDLNSVVPAQCEENDFDRVRHSRCQLAVNAGGSERLVHVTMIVESIRKIPETQANATGSELEASISTTEAANRCVDSPGLWSSVLRWLKGDNQPCTTVSSSNSTVAI